MSIIKKFGLALVLSFVLALVLVGLFALFPGSDPVKEIEAHTLSVNNLLWADLAAVYSEPDFAMGQIGANAVVAVTDPSPVNAHKYSRLTVSNFDTDGNVCVYWTTLGGECSNTNTHYCDGESQPNVGGLVAHGQPPRVWKVANNLRTCLFASSTPTYFHVERIKAE